jgi:hypothetical protein
MDATTLLITVYCLIDDWLGGGCTSAAPIRCCPTLKS